MKRKAPRLAPCRIAILWAPSGRRRLLRRGDSKAGGVRQDTSSHDPSLEFSIAARGGCRRTRGTVRTRRPSWKAWSLDSWFAALDPGEKTPDLRTDPLALRRRTAVAVNVIDVHD